MNILVLFHCMHPLLLLVDADLVMVLTAGFCLKFGVLVQNVNSFIDLMVTSRLPSGHNFEVLELACISVITAISDVGVVKFHMRAEAFPHATIRKNAPQILKEYGIGQLNQSP